MKTLLLAFVALLALLAAQPTFAAEKKKSARDAEREKIDEARDKQRDAINDVLEGKDRNKDGSLTREEYLEGETDKEAAGRKFDEANKNKDRSLSKSEIAEMLGVADDVKAVKDGIRDGKKKK